jgi:hypothetical protein
MSLRDTTPLRNTIRVSEKTMKRIFRQMKKIVGKVLTIRNLQPASSGTKRFLSIVRAYPA